MWDATPASGRTALRLPFDLPFWGKASSSILPEQGLFSLPLPALGHSLLPSGMTRPGPTPWYRLPAAPQATAAVIAARSAVRYGAIRERTQTGGGGGADASEGDLSIQWIGSHGILTKRPLTQSNHPTDPPRAAGYFPADAARPCRIPPSASRIG